MVERIRSLIERYPEDEETVRELVARDSAFDSLCEDYKNIAEALQRLTRESQRRSGAEAEALKKRRALLEEQLLTRIEGYQPT